MCRLLHCMVLSRAREIRLLYSVLMSVPELSAPRRCQINHLQAAVLSHSMPLSLARPSPVKRAPSQGPRQQYR